MRLLGLIGAATLVAGAAFAQSGGVQITRTEFGIVSRNLIGIPKYTPSRLIDSSKDKLCGWAIWVKTDKKKVHVREQITLPSPDPNFKSDARTKVNAAHTVGVSERDDAPKGDGMLSGLWSVGATDPKGHYVTRVTIENLPERVFEFDVK